MSVASTAYSWTAPGSMPGREPMATIRDERTTRLESFEAAAMPHLETLLRSARHITGERHIADDLVQETMLQAWRAFHQFQPGTNCKAWLYRIMLNLWSKLRKKQQPARYIVALDEVELGRESAVLTNLQLSTALDTMPAEQRAVLVLGIVEGFSCREIAEMLALPIGTVMSRLARGREKLRAALEYSSRSQETTKC